MTRPLDLERLRELAVDAVGGGKWCRDYLYNLLRFGGKSGHIECDDDECLKHHPNHYETDYVTEFDPDTCLALVDRITDLEAGAAHIVEYAAIERERKEAWKAAAECASSLLSLHGSCHGGDLRDAAVHRALAAARKLEDQP